MKRIAFAAAFAGVVLAAAAFAPIAAADDPPVTVPTPTTPVPNPDPAPPKGQPKPKASKPASHTTPPRRTPTPVTPRTYTPPATQAHSSSRVAPAARPKHVKKRRAAPKPKPARTHAVKPVPKPAPVVVHPQRRSSEAAPAGVSKGDHDWVGWVLLLVAATGLMMVSLGSMVGAARNPVGARVGALGLRWPRRERIREVVAEPIEQPLTAAAATVALPAPPRVSPAPQPRPAPEPVVEPQPEAAVVAAPPVAARVAEPPPPPVEQEVVAEPTEELCEIFVWRGYAKARFYARLDLDETDEFAVAESPSFRFHGNGTPDNTEAARAAHQALVEKLRAKGWEQEETTGPWYAARFRRPLGRTAS
jgi:hypothetical protein